MVSVMEKLFNAREDLSQLNVNDLITELSDSLAFVGSSNLKLVKTRKESVKQQLPEKFKSICSNDVDFSGALLFGDDLASKLKDITEHNKVMGNFKKYDPTPVASTSRGFYRGRVRGTARGRVRLMSRFSPYNRRLNGRCPWANRR